MKKLFLIFVFALGATLGYAQSAVPLTGEPEIAFESRLYDYGEINENSDGQCEFVFTNTGDEVLILSNVKASCGCTTPTWTKDPIQKGEEGIIMIKYDTKRYGPFEKFVTVTSNAKNSPIRLTVIGEVK